MIWVAVIAVLMSAASVAWAYFRTRSSGLTTATSPATLKIVSDFDEKKKSEAQRIAGEFPDDLLKDLNRNDSSR